LNGLRNCLKRGIGFSISPEVSVQEELSAGSLTKLEWNADQMETSIIMIWHAEKWCSPLLKHFMTISENIISA
jgi:hypothetical protein